MVSQQDSERFMASRGLNPPPFSQQPPELRPELWYSRKKDDSVFKLML